MIVCLVTIILSYGTYAIDAAGSGYSYIDNESYNLKGVARCNKRLENYKAFIKQFRDTIASDFAPEKLVALESVAGHALYFGIDILESIEIHQYLIIHQEIETSLSNKCYKKHLISRLSGVLDVAERELDLLPKSFSSEKECKLIDNYGSQLNEKLSAPYREFLDYFFSSNNEYLTQELLTKIADSKPITGLYAAYFWIFIANDRTLEIIIPSIDVIEINGSRNKIILTAHGCCANLEVKSYYLDLENLDQLNRLRNYTTLIDIYTGLQKTSDFGYVGDFAPSYYLWDKEKEIILMYSDDNRRFQLDKYKKHWREIVDKKE